MTSFQSSRKFAIIDAYKLFALYFLNLRSCPLVHVTVSFFPLTCYNICLLIARPILFGFMVMSMAHVTIYFFRLICYNICLLIARPIYFLNLCLCPMAHIVVSLVPLICYNIYIWIARPIFFGFVVTSICTYSSFYSFIPLFCYNICLLLISRTIFFGFAVMCIDTYHYFIHPFNLLQYLHINCSPYIFWICCHLHWHMLIVSFIHSFNLLQYMSVINCSPYIFLICGHVHWSL